MGHPKLDESELDGILVCNIINSLVVNQNE
jgi:hypothetical protein